MNSSSNLLEAPLDRAGIEALLPHRSPILLVDRVLALYGPPRTELRASYRVPVDHPILAGHFPGRPVWPGVLTIEGLAQASNLLGVMLDWVSEAGTLAPPKPAEGVEHRGLLAGVDVKLLSVVEPDDLLEYSARLIGAFGVVRRIEVSASVGRRVVARGKIAVAVEPG
jgi:3-hydroxyacyl-[acyl-carrier-protein] dehydratase